LKVLATKKSAWKEEIRQVWLSILRDVNKATGVKFYIKKEVAILIITTFKPRSEAKATGTL